ncbi:D-hexose-6-phosphate mutarotase [Yinghuangia soli]|uniref:Putative glucose-6-phosphate 1-epimerase n=1 Tax=Yinghuangia soli TaxID=2908204 RepID=A0AA41Q2I4_9ACTN|nr:D-hexose-6-phosphate mutarotase [Yinghuangia soli]MCF2530343.1 D-hexose-6-phosphate mutarotase [Yinghuangia soli]
MLDELLALPIDQQPAPAVSRRRMGRIPVVVVDHAAARAVVSEQGAQLLAWQPAGAEPVVWLSEKTAWTPGVAIRGGIPVCWPWFGGAGSPAHGFARTSLWELEQVEEEDAEVRLAFVLRSSPETLALWPHAFTLTARIRIGAECTVEIEAQGEHRSTGALHTYLDVAEADATRVTGLGPEYVDKVHGDAPGRQDGPLVPDERVDRIYTRPEPVSRVEDAARGRVVEVHHRGHSDVVAWNPGEELAAGMADVPDDAYRRFVCVETARIESPLTAGPGRPAVLGTTLRIGG